jgi:hypothetical protein
MIVIKLCYHLVGEQGPVVVLARAIAACERLLLHKSSQSILRGHLVDDLHHDQVLIDLGGDGAEKGGELILTRCDLLASKLGRELGLVRVKGNG